MRKRRILPATWPSTSWPLSSLHAEHRVREGLDHLALELDLLFLGHARPSVAADSAIAPPESARDGLAAGAAAAVVERRRSWPPAPVRRRRGRPCRRRWRPVRRRRRRPSGRCRRCSGSAAAGWRRCRSAGRPPVRRRRGRRSAARVPESGAEPAAGRAVRAEERLRLERLLRLREVAAERALGACFMYSPQIGAGTCRRPTPGIGSREVWRSRPRPRSSGCGVKPTNQASVKSSVVPVLPAAGQPICARGAGAALDVLLQDLGRLVAVTPSVKTFLRCGLPRSSTWPSGNAPCVIAIGRMR